MSDYHINIFYSEADGGYIADIPDLRHCSAFGETPEQALEAVQEARAAWLEAARAEGKAHSEAEVSSRDLPDGLCCLRGLCSREVVMTEQRLAGRRPDRTWLDLLVAPEHSDDHWSTTVV